MVAALVVALRERDRTTVVSGDCWVSKVDGPYQRAIDAHPAKSWSPQRTLSYARRPEFAPGSRWEYNNANYILAGLAIERATGLSVGIASVAIATVAERLRHRHRTLRGAGEQYGEDSLPA